jgi:hypothetical protein
MKGQYFSFDAIIASVIFVLALVALLSYWHSVRSFLEYQNDPLSKEAIRVSNLLFVPASPSSDCASMTGFGLAVSYEDRRANSSIIKCINATKDEAWLRAALGTPYNVSIKVTKISDGSSMYLGGDVPSGPTNVVRIRRLSTVYNVTDGTTYLASFDLSMFR